MIVSRTPLRMSFVGGGSDLPAFYRDEIGAVVSTSINKYIFVALRRKFDRRIRLSYSKTEEVDEPWQVEHPLVREALSLAEVPGGIEIASLADIPSRGSGLGSSSSFTVGLMHALHAFCGRYASKEMLAKQACEIEIDRCGEPIGKQDQYAASYGGLNLIRFYPDETVSVDPVICPPHILKEIEDWTAVYFTGRTRSASDILSKQSKALQSNDRKAIVRQMVTLAFDLKSELENGSLHAFGEILDANWRLKRELAEGISDSQIDFWFEKAIANGALGGKLLGAGKGGFLMFFAPPDTHQKIGKALGLERISIDFDKIGTQIIYFQD